MSASNGRHRVQILIAHYITRAVGCRHWPPVRRRQRDLCAASGTQRGIYSAWCPTSADPIPRGACTRKALRFFAERRVKTHFVDLEERAAAPAELKRFAPMFGVQALVDRDSRRFTDLGLGAARLSDERWLDRLGTAPVSWGESRAGGVVWCALVGFRLPCYP